MCERQVTRVRDRELSRAAYEPGVRGRQRLDHAHPHRPGLAAQRQGLEIKPDGVDGVFACKDDVALDVPGVAGVGEQLTALPTR